MPFRESVRVQVDRRPKVDNVFSTNLKLLLYKSNKSASQIQSNVTRLESRSRITRVTDGPLANNGSVAPMGTFRFERIG
jgi:hypothetical protein